MIKSDTSELARLSLDQVIGNPDLGSCRLATDEELGARFGEIPPGTIAAQLDDWYPIAISIAGQPLIIILVGYFDDRGWGTSSIETISPEMDFALTYSGSYYTLGPPARGDVPPELVRIVCALLNRWKVSPKLKVPPIGFGSDGEGSPSP